MTTANTATNTRKDAQTQTHTPAPVSAHDWSFAPESVTVNSRTFKAEYSIARGGDVYVFAQVGDMPVRIHVGTDMPMHADCLAAAQAASKASKPAEPVQASKPAHAPAPAPVNAPVPADKPAPAKKPAASKASKPAEPAQASKPAQAPAPAPVNAPAQADKPAPAKKPAASKASKPAEPAQASKPAPAPVNAPAPAPVDKAWIGTTITGKGWNIAFDEATQRTRVLFQAEPTQAQRKAIEDAGFFWSAQLHSWNKKLTCKAHRAALALAETLNALA